MQDEAHIEQDCAVCFSRMLLSLIRAVPASQQVTIRDNSVCHLVRAGQSVTLPHAENMLATLSCIESFSQLDNSKQVNLHGTGDSDFPMTRSLSMSQQIGGAGCMEYSSQSG